MGFFENKWAWGGVVVMFILWGIGALAAFPIFQAFGAVFLLGTFPLLIAMGIPLIIGGWFLGVLAGKIYHTFI